MIGKVVGDLFEKPPNYLQGFVRAVTLPAQLTMLASAYRIGLFDRNFKFFWLKFCAFVRAITKRLILTSPASAPPIDAGFEFHFDGMFLENFWCCHVLKLKMKNDYPFNNIRLK